MSSKGCAQPVTGGAWRLNLALGIKKFFFPKHHILGTLNFTTFTGSKYRTLFNFHITAITGIQIMWKANERLLEQAEGTALAVSYKTFLQTADYQ